MRVEQIRGGVVEAVDVVHVAVVDSTGGLVARTGDPELVTFWRSAAKPFQALPLLEDGAAARFGLTSEELALACASHSSEPDRWLGCANCSARSGARSAISCAARTHRCPIGWPKTTRRAAYGLRLSTRTARGNMPVCSHWRATTAGPRSSIRGSSTPCSSAASRR